NSEANLYFINYQGSDIYLMEVDGKMHKLANSETEVYRYDVKYNFRKNEYIGVLTVLMNDANIQSEIESTPFNRKSLVKLGKKYNDIMCPGSACVVYEEKPNKVRIGIGAIGGWNSKALAFDNWMK